MIASCYERRVGSCVYQQLDSDSISRHHKLHSASQQVMTGQCVACSGPCSGFLMLAHVAAYQHEAIYQIVADYGQPLLQQKHVYNHICATASILFGQLRQSHAASMFDNNICLASSLTPIASRLAYADMLQSMHESTKHVEGVLDDFCKTPRCGI